MTTPAPDLPILVVEDSDEDYTALKWALHKIGVTRPLRRCDSADAALAYLRRADVPPALVFLDLNLGGADGRDLLAAVKSDAALRRIPVVVWTTSAHPADIDLCYDRGANGYATKPADVEQLLASLRAVTRYWFDYMVLPDVAPQRAATAPPARAS